MKHHVEFLPARYRHRRAARRNVLRRLGAVAAVAAGIGSAALWQHRQERQVQAELLQAQAQERVVQANQARLEELHWQVASTRAAAELCVFLERTWPRTRIFAAVEDAVPDAVELTELGITQESLNAAAPAARTPAARTPAARGASQRAAAEEGPAASRDLRRLVNEFGRTRTVVRIAGAANDPAAIHRFVANLSRDPLFARTELSSLESLEHPERGVFTRFAVRIVLRDEYGSAFDGEAPSTAAVQTARRAP